MILTISIKFTKHSPTTIYPAIPQTILQNPIPWIFPTIPLTIPITILHPFSPPIFLQTPAP